MDWSVQSVQDLGAIGEFGASVAVLISLIYVGFQLKQNGKLARIQGTEDRHKRLTGWGRLLLENPDFDRIFREGCQSLDALSEEERRIFDRLMREYLSILLGMRADDTHRGKLRVICEQP